MSELPSRPVSDSSPSPILKASGLAAVLAVGFVAVGFAVATPIISGTASLLGFDELVSTGPTDLLIARLKVVFALATAPVGAWLATLVAQLRRGGEPWGAAFGLRFALVLVAVAAGMTAKVMYLRWAVSVHEARSAFVAPVAMVGEVAPGSWGLAAGILATIVLAVVAGLRGPTDS